ncbi:MAG: hypothetical protein R3F59_13170 [Myxococcota bacterium]
MITTTTTSPQQGRNERTRPWWEGAGLAWRGTPVCRLLARLALRGEAFPRRAAVELGAALFDVLCAGHARGDAEGGPVGHGRVSSNDVWITPVGEVVLQASATPTDEADAPWADPTPADDVREAAELVVVLLGVDADRADPERTVDAVRDVVGATVGARTFLALLRLALSPDPAERRRRVAGHRARRPVRRIGGEVLPDFAARMQHVSAAEAPTLMDARAALPPRAPPAQGPSDRAARRRGRRSGLARARPRRRRRAGGAGRQLGLGGPAAGAGRGRRDGASRGVAGPGDHAAARGRRRDVPPAGRRPLRGALRRRGRRRPRHPRAARVPGRRLLGAHRGSTGTPSSPASR